MTSIVTGQDLLNRINELIDAHNALVKVVGDLSESITIINDAIFAQGESSTARLDS